MDAQQLMQLERAAVEVMSPPYAVSAEKRKEAEAIFLDLRKSKLPYETCKYILEHSQSDYVLFQAASTIKEGVIREWTVLSREHKESLRAYVMHYITSRPDLVSYVREQLLHTVALMVKRATLEEDRRKLFDSVFSTVSQLLAMDSKMRQLGCSLLSALLSEYSSSSGSSNVGLPLEFHCQCKKAIEGEELLRILLFAVQALQQYLSVEWAGLSQEEGTLLGSFLQLTSQILNWDFRQIQYRPTTPLWGSDPSSIPLRPPKLYAQSFLDPSFLELFFKLLGKVRSREDHMHHVIQSLTQLASLTKPVFSTDEEQQSYVRNFVTGILAYVSSSPDLNHQEVYGLSCILRRLATTFPSRHFSALGAACLGLLVQTLAQLTVLCAQRTVQEEEEDSLTYQESLEHFLEVWVCLLEEAESLPPALLTQPSIDVFQAYVQSKLSAPRGWRTVRCDDEEIVELVEDDRTTYADQLCSVGYLSRTIAEHSIPLLAGLLEQCTSECAHIHEMICRDKRTLFTCQNNLDSLYEDLHWLVLIAGYTLCDIVRGEDVLIPVHLMRHSIARQPHVQVTDLDVRSLILQEGGGDVVDLSSAHMDPVVMLILSIFRLCVLEKRFISRGLLDVLSPQVCETTAWCLSCVAEPYLMLCEESYDQLSLPLLSVFGRDSESARWLVAFLLEKVTFNLSVWSAETSLTLTTIQLLKSIVKSPARTAVAMHCEALWSLMRRFSSGHTLLSSLPPSVQRELMSGLVMCGAGEQREPFLAELLQPLRHRFTSLVQRPDLQSHSQDGGTQQGLLAMLESLCGLAQSSRPDSVPEFFAFMLPFLQVGVSLLEVFTDVPEVTEVILELFALVAENYTVFLNESQTTQLYEVSLGLIQTYAKCNTGKYSRVALAEEEQCEDLLLFMRILTHLTSKDFLDFGNSGPSAVQPVDVIITGINTILPLISEEILKFPMLCQQFYTLIHYICEIFPEKVAVLPEKLFVACMQLIEAGISNYGSDICKLSLESIESVAVHYCTSSEPHIRQSLVQSLQHFLKMLFEMMLSSSFDMDLIGPASGATFALICAQKEYYSSLASALVSSQSNPQNHSRLADALHGLTPPSLKLEHVRSSRLQFRKNLEVFLPFVKGFLYYR